MGTRSTTHFLYDENEKAEAIVYRHWDGYPSVAGNDIRSFLADCGKLSDPRFTDPSYLAAKYVVFLAEKFRDPKNDRLEFLSVRIVREDPCDIEYRYEIRCGKIIPEVKCWDVYGEAYIEPFDDGEQE